MEIERYDIGRWEFLGLMTALGEREITRLPLIEKEENVKSWEKKKWSLKRKRWSLEGKNVKSWEEMRSLEKKSGVLRRKVKLRRKVEDLRD